VPLGVLHRDRMRDQIEALRPAGYTPIGLALRTAVSQLPTGDDPQAIVLVSDGEDTCGTPPCDAAREAKRAHPNLAISTVGFKTAGAASDELACIAAVTGGLFVQAGNAGQLVSRLTAIQHIGQARKSLTSTGWDGIALGMTWADVRRAHGDFPDAAPTGEVTVVYRDCDFRFVDGVLDMIGPHDGGRTIDGVGPGTDLAEAVDLYGPPVSTETTDDGAHAVVFVPDPGTDAGYWVLVDGFAQNGGTVSGTVKRVALCRCAPKAGSPASPRGDEPERVVLKAVDAQGDLQPGWTRSSRDGGSPIDCTFGSPSPYDVTSGVRFCGGTADSGDACWPAGGSSLLCLRDPFRREVDPVSADGASVPLRARAPGEPRPMGLVLDDGTTCRARIGGAWDTPVEHPDWVGYFGCDGARWSAVWAPSHSDGGIEKGPDGWTVWVGPSDGHLTQRRIVQAIYVGMA
jgi:hypothetical protein